MTARLELPVNPDGGKEPTGGSAGPAGEGVAPGGTTGQSLVKQSNADFDTEWEQMATLLALGEVANEVSDLVAALGDPDQIAWGAAWDAAGEATGFPADGLFGFVIAKISEPSPYHISFETDAATMTPVASSGFDEVALQAGSLTGAVRTSTGTVDDYVTFPLAGTMMTTGGLWTFTLTHFTGPDCGIYSIELTDDDGATWNVVGTVDGYAAVPAAEQNTVVGVAVGPANDTVRVRMGAKNVLSTSFVGHVSALSGYFVFT